MRPMRMTPTKTKSHDWPSVMIGSARDDKQFRRGVVLGLTMAEALLLLIFLLMLMLLS